MSSAPWVARPWLRVGGGGDPILRVFRGCCRECREARQGPLCWWGCWQMSHPPRVLLVGAGPDGPRSALTALSGAGSFPLLGQTTKCPILSPLLPPWSGTGTVAHSPPPGAFWRRGARAGATDHLPARPRGETLVTGPRKLVYPIHLLSQAGEAAAASPAAGRVGCLGPVLPLLPSPLPRPAVGGVGDSCLHGPALVP